MGDLTTDPKDPDLGRGVNELPVPENKKYLILSDADRRKGFIRPVRQIYTHDLCTLNTVMSLPIAETFARNPRFYAATYCAHCLMHRPVNEFVWKGTRERVGS